MKKSNRILSKYLKYISNLDFKKCSNAYLKHMLATCRFPFDSVDLIPTQTNCIYRAVQIVDETCLNKISRISYNPNPQSLSRCNFPGRAIAYYACDSDVAMLEACHEDLKKGNKHTFDVIVSQWKIKKELSLQLICNNQEAKNVATDLENYYRQCLNRRKELYGYEKKYLRGWFLKTRFIADLFARESSNFQDYFITAYYVMNLFNQANVQGVIYPSVQYKYKGFNYALLPKLWDNDCFKLIKVFRYKLFFDKKDIGTYPQIRLVASTNQFEDDNIIWNSN